MVTPKSNNHTASFSERTDLGDRDELLGEIVSRITDELGRGEPLDLSRYERDFPDHIAQIKGLLPAIQTMIQLAPGDSCDRSVFQEPLLEKRLGDFRILNEIGRGGMGVVYEAEQISMGRNVALKVLPFAALLDEKAITRFKNEARAAGTLHHPNIVPVHGFGEERGVYYYAMTLIDGQTLANLIEECRSDPARRRGRVNQSAESPASPGPGDVGRDESPVAGTAADTVAAPLAEKTTQCEPGRNYLEISRIGAQAAEALQHAHERGIVHRDIKPGNLILDRFGKVWVTDFGLARIEADPGVTVTGDMIGTIRYMAPEQALGNPMVVDHRVDVYSLAATLYELVALKPLLDGKHREAVLRQLSLAEPRPLRHARPDVPHDLETVLLKALSKNPGDRYNSAGEMARDLRAFLKSEPITAKRPSIRQRASRWAQRHQAVIALAAIALILLSAGLAVTNRLFARQRNRAEAAKNAAVAAGQREATQRKAAEASFRHAREVVDRFLTKVSQDKLFGTDSTQPLRKELLELALEYYREFIRQRSGDESLQADLAAAYARVAAITAEIGSIQDAITAHLAALEIHRELFARQSDPGYHLHRMAQSHNDLASLYEAIGKRDEALERWYDSLRTAERLERSHPGRFDTRPLLADVHNNLGILYERMGDATRALEEQLRALRIRQQLVSDNPAVRRYKSRLAVSHHNLGLLYQKTGQSARALASLQQAVSLKRELLQEEPNDLAGMESLAISCKNLGIAQERTGDLAGARASCREGIAILRQLVDRNPAVIKYRRNLAACWSSLADVNATLDDLDAAVNAYLMAIEILGDLREKRPEERASSIHLAVAHNNLGLTLNSLPNRPEAIRHYRLAVEILEPLVASESAGGSLHAILAMSYQNLGLALERVGQTAEAIRALESAMRANPDDVDPIYRLAWLLALTTDDDLSDPERAIRLALEATERDPSSGEYWHAVALARYRAADWQAALAAQETAQKKIDKAAQPCGHCRTTGGFIRALVLWQLGRTSDAIQAQKAALAEFEQLESRQDELTALRDEARRTVDH